MGREIPKRFAKVKGPFERVEDDDGHYVVRDEVQDGYEWVFENDHVLAVEKIDGTNCAVKIQQTSDGSTPVEAYTRHGPEGFQVAETFGSTPHQNIVRAVQNSFRRGYLNGLSDGIHYGEAVGPDFQGNPHELDENLFVPFSWLADKCRYKSWGDYPKTFDVIEGWFENDLFSLFYSRMHGVGLEEASVSNGVFCEGIMFLHPQYAYTEADMEFAEEHMSSGHYRKIAPNIAKLRRDMHGGFQRDEWPMTEFGH